MLSMPRSLALTTLVPAVLIALLGAQAAWAQGSTTRVTLDDGGTASFDGIFGGDVSASTIDNGCVGYVSTLPNYVLELTTDGWVRISVEVAGEGDATLLVRRPSGALCNDDADNHTHDPEIVTFLPAGEYYVHVGSFNLGESGAYSIHFRHGGEAVIPELSGDQTMRLLGTSGGTMDARSLGDGCVGAIPASPNHTVRLRQRSYVAIEADSASDLTLVVQSRNGTYCSDDARNSLNPAIGGWFEEGPLQIYVGSHNPSVEAPYELTVTPATARGGRRGAGGGARRAR
jgi:hypothetical protein